ncbi:sterol desaturase family protein [Kiloniella antarctica]|uniref:Sterol desaturase family protein n=1 Tax=Kiloniella antarctica TaxID=1550907 RepID=A0ABW5BJS7_9PROT
MVTLTEQLLAYKGVIVLTWIALLFFSERLIPAERGDLSPDAKALEGKTKFARFFPVRVFRNSGLWVFNVVLSPLLILQVTIWATEHSLQWRPFSMAEWPELLLELIIDILILDFLIYWWHRLNHEVPFLWRFHEIHHLDDTLDTTSALRFHFGEILLSAMARAGVIILLNIPFVSIVVFETVVLIATVFHHSNVRIKKIVERILGYIFITPEIHWVHHHAIQVDTDSNYGTIFSWWDPFFQTRSQNPRKAGMRIGVEGTRDKSFMSLLIRPFKKK